MAEGIYVKIKADSSDYVKELDKAEKSTKDFEKTSKGTAVSLKGLAKGFGVASVAAGGLATGLTALTVNAADNAREIKNLSAVAGVGVEEFQKMAFAAKDVGIEQDKLSDILKDVNDKVGDFLTTGAGGMVDFFEQVAPKVGITADAFRDLNSREALQLYIDSLEKANLSQAEMTFQLEAIASDATALLPLLRNNGKELNNLGDEAERLGAVLSEADIRELSEAAKNIDRLKTAFASLGNELAKNVAPKLTGIVDGITEFYKELNDKEAQETAKEIESRMAGIQMELLLANGQLGVMKTRIKDIKSAADTSILGDIESQKELIKSLRLELDQLKTARNEVLGIEDESAFGFDESANEDAQSVVKSTETSIAAQLNWLEQYRMMRDEQLEISRQKNAELEAEEQRAADARKQIQQAEFDARFAIASAGLTGISLLFDKESKKGFEAQKKIAYAQTLLSGYQSAQKAYEGGLTISGGQPWVGAAFAATSVAATLKQLQGISSTSYNSTGGAPSAAGGGSAQSQGQQATQQNVSISIEGDTVSRAQVGSLVDQLNEEIANGGQITGISLV